MYTELTIQISILDQKLDKVLELLSNQQQFTIINPTIQGESRAYPIPEEWKTTNVPYYIEHGEPVGNFKAELQSDNENFEDSYK